MQNKNQELRIKNVGILVPVRPWVRAHLTKLAHKEEKSRAELIADILMDAAKQLSKKHNLPFEKPKNGGK